MCNYIRVIVLKSNYINLFLKISWFFNKIDTKNLCFYTYFSPLLLIGMASIWGDTKDTQEAVMNSFEENIERILKRKEKINLEELMKLISHNGNLLTDYQRLLNIIDKLLIEGKISIDEEKNIRMTTLSVLGSNGVDEIPVWDLIHKEKDIELKKEIIRRYNQINPYL